jgi:hypothetical protein
VGNFVDSGIVSPQNLLPFHRAIQSEIRLRNSIPFEVGLIL